MVVVVRALSTYPRYPVRYLMLPNFFCRHVPQGSLLQGSFLYSFTSAKFRVAKFLSVNIAAAPPDLAGGDICPSGSDSRNETHTG